MKKNYEVGKEKQIYLKYICRCYAKALSSLSKCNEKKQIVTEKSKKLYAEKAKVEKAEKYQEFLKYSDLKDILNNNQRKYLENILKTLKDICNKKNENKEILKELEAEKEAIIHFMYLLRMEICKYIEIIDEIILLQIPEEVDEYIIDILCILYLWHKHVDERKSQEKSKCISTILLDKNYHNDSIEERGIEICKAIGLSYHYYKHDSLDYNYSIEISSRIKSLYKID